MGLREMVRAMVQDELNAAILRAFSDTEGTDVVGLGVLPTPVGNGKDDEAEPEKPRKKNRKKQLCPVPGCKQAAAPVFGMVCAKHKDVPKSKIAVYRDARKGVISKAEAAEQLARIEKKNSHGKSKAKAKPKAKPMKNGEGGAFTIPAAQ